MNRLTKNEVYEFFDAVHERVSYRDVKFIEDFQGDPLAVAIEGGTAYLVTSLPLLGWSFAQFQDQAVSE